MWSAGLERIRALRGSRPARRIAAVGGVCGLAAGLVGTVGNLERIPSQLCRIPGVHSACQWLAVGGVAGEAEERLWASAAVATEPTPLRAYLREYPKGAYIELARTRLAACRAQQVEAWTPEQRRLPLFVAAPKAALPNRADAENLARQRALEEAQVACAAFVGEFRVRAARLEHDKLDCSSRLDGRACSYDGGAICELDVRKLSAVERCE